MSKSLVPQIVEDKILNIRGQKVMLDKDLATLYCVPTKVLNQTVKRNKKRFPLEFMFQLTKEEWENLKSQFVTSSWGGSRTLPYAFTEHGVSMLSSVLNSPRAIEISIQIINTFVALKRYISQERQQSVRIGVLEQALLKYIESNDKRISEIIEIINAMVAEDVSVNQIGFIKKED